MFALLHLCSFHLKCAVYLCLAGRATRERSKTSPASSPLGAERGHTRPLRQIGVGQSFPRARSRSSCCEKTVVHSRLLAQEQEPRLRMLSATVLLHEARAHRPLTVCDVVPWIVACTEARARRWLTGVTERQQNFSGSFKLTSVIVACLYVHCATQRYGSYIFVGRASSAFAKDSTLSIELLCCACLLPTSVCSVFSSVARSCPALAAATCSCSAFSLPACSCSPFSVATSVGSGSIRLLSRCVWLNNLCLMNPCVCPLCWDRPL